MKMRRNAVAAVSSLAVMSAALLAGCGASAAVEEKQVQEAGSLILSVNPEIQIAYDREGRVIDLSGMNADGKSIVSSYHDYIGRPCGDVLKELIGEINEAGYFVAGMDGTEKDIVLQLEPGSLLPGKDFMGDISSSTRNAVRELHLSSGIVTIEEDDYDPNYSRNGNPSRYILLDKAKEIALAQANVSAADAVFAEREFDHDDGTPVFELEFTANGLEYAYDVHAETGRILKAEREADGAGSGAVINGAAGRYVTDYNDTDYGPNNDGVTDYDDTDYGPNNDGVTDYDDTDYGPNNDGVTDYNDTDYGPNNDGVTDYDDTDYGPNNDGVTDYNNTDYGPNNDGVTDYNDTDYGPNNDGVTDYDDTDYGPNNDGVTDYNDTDYGPNNDGVTDYAYTDYGDTNYDDGGDTDYDDGESDYDD